MVPESVSNPLKYYGNNTCATRSLLEAASAAGVKHFVFSSTAAVYGIPASGQASEESATSPINAYGTSKLMSEWMLRDLCAATPMRHVVLRYFNVAGCDTQGRIGQSTRQATLLVKVACEVAVGKRPHLSVFGTDAWERRSEPDQLQPWWTQRLWRRGTNTQGNVAPRQAGRISEVGSATIAASASPALWAKRNSSSPTEAIRRTCPISCHSQRASE